ncbi:MAG: SCO4402 family protein [Anaerolineae bacterium]
MSVRNHNLRNEVIYYVDILSNPEKQRDVWIELNYPEGVEEDCLDFAIHLFFDDTSLAYKPEALIGDILVNQLEARLIKNLTDILGEIIDELGDVPDINYLKHSKWIKVVNKARQVKEVIEENNS